jgi:hypothetical protein
MYLKSEVFTLYAAVSNGHKFHELAAEEVGEKHTAT